MGGRDGIQIFLKRFGRWHCAEVKNKVWLLEVNAIQVCIVAVKHRYAVAMLSYARKRVGKDRIRRIIGQSDNIFRISTVRSAYNDAALRVIHDFYQWF